MIVTVPPASAGERLDRFLAALEEVGSRAAAERLLASGAVLVDGAARAKSHRLEGGEEVDFEPPERAVSELVPEEMELRVAYEDEHLLVVDKPAGIVVHPSAGHAEGTLVHGLLAHSIAGGEEPSGPGSCTGSIGTPPGLLVVARSDEAHRRLQRQLTRREITREYLALVRGRPRSWRGRVEAPIGRDRHDATRISLDTDTPREAITDFEVEELFREHALLRVRLQTGRTHQIRVHLAAIDLPVSGDPTYGVPGRSGSRAPVPARRAARLPAPVHGRGGRGRVAAAIGSRTWRSPQRVRLGSRVAPAHP